MGTVHLRPQARSAPLAVEALTAEAFAPFGEVIELPRHAAGVSINNGSCVRHHDLVRPIAVAPGAVSLSLFDAAATPMPTVLQVMERHRLGSQAFAPFGAMLRALVVVADGRLSPEQLTPETLRAFITNGRQGFQLRPGVWHHPLLSVQDGTWLVADRVAEHMDCDVLPIQTWQVLFADLPDLALDQVAHR